MTKMITRDLLNQIAELTNFQINEYEHHSTKFKNLRRHLKREYDYYGNDYRINTIKRAIKAKNRAINNKNSENALESMNQFFKNENLKQERKLKTIDDRGRENAFEGMSDMFENEDNKVDKTNYKTIFEWRDAQKESAQEILLNEL